MRIQKLASTDAFVAWDLDGAERFVGIARLAPKILVEGAQMLARSVTYSFAAFGVRAAGASAGINAKPEGRDEAVAEFVSEIEPEARAGRLLLRAGSGLRDEDLAPLTRAEYASLADDELVAHSAVAAAEAALGALAGKSVTICGQGPVADAAAIALSDKGATVEEGSLDATADAVFVAGKPGWIDHEVAAGIRAAWIVPLSPVPLTAKAYATVRRAGVAYLPDFVTLAAPLLAACDGASSTEPVERVREVTAAIAPHGPDAWLVAAGLSEAFLGTWQDTLPFGRPLW